MWAEHYHGDLNDSGRKTISNTHLAAELRGKLLLIHGELDDNAHPYQTMRLAHALIKADKDFDPILIPGGEHALFGYQHYAYRRTWDYFVAHLHGTEPPGYRLAPLLLPQSVARMMSRLRRSHIELRFVVELLHGLVNGPAGKVRPAGASARDSTSPGLAARARGVDDPSR